MSHLGYMMFEMLFMKRTGGGGMEFTFNVCVFLSTGEFICLGQMFAMYYIHIQVWDFNFWLR